VEPECCVEKQKNIYIVLMDFCAESRPSRRIIAPVQHT
jgi:hypothetical protein